MKKLLALVLALVMTLSLCTISNAFTDDKSINEDYAEAVQVLNGMGVFKGYEDGSFKPEGSITRAEVAAIIYRIYTADVKDKNVSLYEGYGNFTDLDGAKWAKGYIGYCANAAFVKGMGDGTFQPAANVTGYQALAMILRAMGYDQNGEFEGVDWELHVAQIAQQLGILKNVKNVSLKIAATRELVAELLFQAIQENCVTYTPALGYSTLTAVLNGKEIGSLGENNFDLDKDDNDPDEFGRPSYSWTYKTGNKETKIEQKPVVTYTTEFTDCEALVAEGIPVTDKKTVSKLEKLYINGVLQDADGEVSHKTCGAKYGDQGLLVEIYDMDDDEYRVVAINTYFGIVTKAVDAKTDKKGHTDAAYVKVDVYFPGAEDIDDDGVEYTFETDEFKKGDLVLANISWMDVRQPAEDNGEIIVLTAADSVTDAWHGFKTNNTELKVGSDWEKKACTYVDLTEEGLKKNAKYVFAYDMYGNIIAVLDPEDAAAQYCVIDELYIEVNKGTATMYGTLVLPTGELLEDVEIGGVEVDGKETDVTDYAPVEVGNKLFEGFYETLVCYTEDDGVYTLSEADCDKEVSEKYDVVYLKKGDKTITGKDFMERANKDTLYLIQVEGAPEGEYEAYEGYQNVPTLTAKQVEIVLDDDNYASIVYVNDVLKWGDSETVVVLDGEPTKVESYDKDKSLATFDVLYLTDKGELKDGEIKVVFADDEDPWDYFKFEGMGIYTLYYDADGYVKDTKNTGEYGKILEFFTPDLLIVNCYPGNVDLEDMPVFVWDAEEEEFVADELNKEENTDDRIALMFNDDDEVIAVFDIEALL